MFQDITCGIMQQILRDTSMVIVNPRSDITRFNPLAFMDCITYLNQKTYHSAQGTYKKIILPEVWKMQGLILDRSILDSLLQQKKIYQLEKNLPHFRNDTLYYLNLRVKQGHEVGILIFHRHNSISICAFFWRGKSALFLPHLNFKKNYSEMGLEFAISPLREKAHTGYESLFSQLREETIHKLLNVIADITSTHKNRKKVHIVLSGLSTGGNMATLMGHHLKAYLPFPVNILTFGSQRVLTRDQISQFSVLSPRQHLRVYNSTDVLTFIPHKKSGYYHPDEAMHSKHYVGIDLVVEWPKEVLTVINRYWFLPRLIFWHLSYIFDHSKRQIISHACSKL